MNLNLLDDIEDIDSFLAELDDEEKKSLLKYLQVRDQYIEENKILFFVPDKWQARAITLGKTEPYRMVCAANRLGKSYFASYEASVHATGRYPHDWAGMRYDKPIHVMVLGYDWSQLARPEAIQELVCGSADRRGTGWIPKKDIVTSVLKSGMRNTLEYMTVRHYDSTGKYDGDSKISFAAYSGDDKTIMGTTIDFALLDEQCPENIFQQIVTRGWTSKDRNGNNTARVLYVATPEMGMDPTISQFWNETEYDEDGNITAGRYHSGLIHVTLWDSGQFTEEEKKRMVSSIDPWQAKFRIEGIPSAGAGMVFAGILKESIIEVTPEIKMNWKRLIGVDLGYRDSTTFLFMAKDPETGIYYLYHEEGFEETEAIICASKIRPLQKKFIPAILPKDGKADRGLGVTYRSIYEGAGMKVLKEDAANWYFDKEGKNRTIKAGITYMRELMLSGRFKVHPNCLGFLREFDQYAYDEKNKFTGSDHYIDAARYALMAIDKFGETERDKERYNQNIWNDFDTRKSNY